MNLTLSLNEFNEKSIHIVYEELLKISNKSWFNRFTSVLNKNLL